MLMPKRMKHRKVQRGRRKGSAKGGTNIEFGADGMKAPGDGWLTSGRNAAARIC